MIMFGKRSRRHVDNLFIDLTGATFCFAYTHKIYLQKVNKIYIIYSFISWKNNLYLFSLMKQQIFLFHLLSMFPPLTQLGLYIFRMDDFKSPSPSTLRSSQVPLMRKYIEKKPCSVCSEAGDGAHFGAEACRACAAFFRRSVALQKKYTCRNGGNCPIEASRLINS